MKIPYLHFRIAHNLLSMETSYINKEAPTPTFPNVLTGLIEVDPKAYGFFFKHEFKEIGEKDKRYVEFFKAYATFLKNNKELEPVLFKGDLQETSLKFSIEEFQPELIEKLKKTPPSSLEISNVTQTSQLEAVLDLCPNLKSLSLQKSTLERLPVNFCKDFLGFEIVYPSDEDCLQLEKLEFREVKITFKKASNLFKELKSCLKELSLIEVSFSYLTDLDFESFLLLEKLKLKLARFSGTQWDWDGKEFRQLKELWINDRTHEQKLSSIGAASFPNLEILSISSEKVEFPIKCPNLKKLRISKSQLIGGVNLSFLENYLNLEECYINRTEVDVFPKKISVDLKKFAFKKSNRLGNPPYDLSFLSSCKKLQVLDLTWTNFKGLPNDLGPNLEVVRIGDNKEITNENTGFLKNCPNLRVLDLSETSVDPFLEGVFPNLEKLFLNRNKAVSQASLDALKACPKLKILDLSHVQFEIFPSGLSSQLKVLILYANTKITTKGLEPLEEYQNLKHLNLSFTMVEKIPERISSKLEWVVLIGNGVREKFMTSEGLTPLENCPNLKYLNLAATHITEDQLSEALRNNSRLFIDWKP